MDRLSPEEIQNLKEFKKELFTLYWEKFGTFYTHIIPHPSLKIGKRGLVGEEKESGIVLVFGPKAVRNLEYLDNELYCQLQFGYTWEDVYIPWDAIFRIYDKGQLSLTQMHVIPVIQEIQTSEETHKEKKKSTHAKSKSEDDSNKNKEKGNVIRVDFGGKKNET